MSIDTLDSLKGVWKDIGVISEKGFSMIGEEQINRWNERNRKLRLRFFLEMAASLLIYIAAIVIIIQASADSPSQVFGLKVVLLSLLFYLPASTSLYKSLALLRQGEFTRPMKEYLDDSVTKLHKAIKLYVRYAYLQTAFMTVMLLTDDFFMAQPWALRVSAVSFVVLCALLVKPYRRLTYRNDLQHFEELQKEITDEKQGTFL